MKVVSAVPEVILLKDEVGDVEEAAVVRLATENI